MTNFSHGFWILECINLVQVLVGGGGCQDRLLLLREQTTLRKSCPSQTVGTGTSTYEETQTRGGDKWEVLRIEYQELIQIPLSTQFLKPTWAEQSSRNNKTPKKIYKNKKTEHPIRPGPNDYCVHLVVELWNAQISWRFSAVVEEDATIGHCSSVNSPRSGLLPRSNGMVMHLRRNQEQKWW